MCSLVLGLGFGSALVPDMFLAFLLRTAWACFFYPWRSWCSALDCEVDRLSGWAKGLPFVVFGVALITYGFHALPRCLGPE